MTLAAIPSFLAILFCATLYILLYQYLLPRPAPWRVVAVALGSGVVFTLVLVAVMTYAVTGAHEQFLAISSLADALPVAVFRAGLPEETVKALAAFAAVVMFRRHLSPAAAFQIPLFVAVGFAIVENHGYSDAFPEFRMLIAFGRGLVATFIHSLLAMIQGVILMRIIVPRAAAPEAGLDVTGIAAAPSGEISWNRWYLPILGLLVAATIHALYYWGLLPLTAEYLRTGTVREETAGIPLLVGAGGITLLFVAGLWSLRTGIRRAAALDPIVNDAKHIASIATWRRAGKWLMRLSAVIFIGAIGSIALAAVSAVQQGGDPTGNPELQILGLIGACGVVGAVFMVIIGWAVRQKR